MDHACHYRVDWRSARFHPGSHRSVHAGDGYEFMGHRPLHQVGSARHIDIGASLKDPHGQWQVRCFRQSSAIFVYLLADVSASMLIPAKLDTLTRLANGLARAAAHSGDAFGLLAADAVVRAELCRLPSQVQSGFEEWARQAALIKPTAHSAQGLTELVAYTPHQRSLIFLASDFHFPLRAVQHLSQTLARHDVVPVVIWEPQNPDTWPDYRWVYWLDPESGKRRRYWMRPTLKTRIQAAYEERRQQLTTEFASRGRLPLFLSEPFSADAVTAYFYQGL
ncbi:MAG: DUF58 domain-containing protein [Methylococcaceae bacterium]